MRSYLRLLTTYVRLNLSAQWEYRGAFLSKVLSMMVNDMVWIAFWLLFFDRFPVLRGWTQGDVLTLWAVAATSVGLVAALFGNALALPALIVRGGLDAWMLYPRRLLPHLILGKMDPTGWGDILFGVGAYLFFVQPDPPRLLLFALLSVSGALLFLGFGIATASLAFYLGRAELIAQQWQFALISFSTYPSVLFDGATRLVLYTLIPAAFLTYLPVAALRSFSLPHAAGALGGALAFLALGVALFYRGLRRYESGNLMEMRG